MRILLFSGLAFFWAFQVFAKNEKTWTSIKVMAPFGLSDSDLGYNFNQARTMFGNPPQPINLTLGFSGDPLSSWSIDCNSCLGSELYDPEVSSTHQDMNMAWGDNRPGFVGHWVKDTVGFEGLFEAENIPFVLLDVFSSSITDVPHMNSGHLPLYVNGTAETPGIFQQLWNQGSLMNPVMGMRLDPIKARFTLGALDSEDYEGEINWTAVEDRYDSESGSISVNEFKIDGVKGFNGSLLPFGDHLTSVLDSLSLDIKVPPSNPYAINAGYTGPQQLVHFYPEGGFGYQCISAELPYVHFTVTINGVDYPIESDRSMLRFSSSTSGMCTVAISNTTRPSAFSLGLPFMRSVYVAYRFPTEDCPGYYGFAFPSGSNRTRTQINQKPTSTPDKASQCLSLTKPASTPKAKISSQGKGSNDLKGSYYVYGSATNDQVALLDAESLAAAKWNSSLLGAGAT
jgi:hypothetical protein